MVATYFVFAGVGVVLWTPILLRFYRSWLGRHNPISLAICAIILLLLWLTVSGVWLATGNMRGDVVALCGVAMSSLVAAFAHLAFYWSSKKFPESRKKE
jgi:hypothetical protein